MELKVIDFVYGKKKETISASVPVKFEPETPYIKLYFLNDRLDNGKSDRIVFPVERKNILKKDGPKTAVEELMEGPTEGEKAAGYYTKFPMNSFLASLGIDQNGVLEADFSKELEFCGSMPCPVAVGAPIYETLYQFCDIKEVNIYTDNGREDFFPSDSGYLILH